MFTGLVAGLGDVERVEATDDGARLVVAAELAAELSPGDSVSVAGVCLTALDQEPGRFAAEAVHETLRRSTLSALVPGDRVNLELPLRPADRLGGHVVSGHVDGLGTVVEAREDGFARVVTVGASDEVLRYVVEKGSIAIDGVSLTVVDVGEDAFSVWLIPETRSRTTLGDVAVGSRVNLEVDVLAKYVERLVSRTAR